MASLIRKMVDRAKSRSKSPVKSGNKEFKPWRRHDPRTQTMMYYQHPFSEFNDATTHQPFVHPAICQSHQSFEHPIFDGYSHYEFEPQALSSDHDVAAIAAAAAAATAADHYHQSGLLTEPGAANNELTTRTEQQQQQQPSRHHLHAASVAISNGDATNNEEMPQWMVGHEKLSTNSLNSHHSRTELFKESSSSMNRQNLQFNGDNPLYSPSHHSDNSMPSSKLNEYEYGGAIIQQPAQHMHVRRPRSVSPFKKSAFSSLEKFNYQRSRSKSPMKKCSTIATKYDYLSPHCQIQGCSAALIVQDTKFLVCKHQLSHSSDYFRSLFLANKSLPVAGAQQFSENEFAIVVSSFKHPPPATQFKWFLECAIQTPILRDITDENLETCMRLSKRFAAKGLEMRCARYIQTSVSHRSPMVALCWLNWVLKHKFDRTTHDACLPCVAMASLRCLEEHRNMITERLLADLLAAKLRTLCDQAVNVFRTIHQMDHFSVTMDNCPRCGNREDFGKIRVYASPCSKLLGCDRCIKGQHCKLQTRMQKSLQAFYQCEHGLNALNDETADCPCQIPILANHLARSGLQHNGPISRAQ